MGAKWTTFGEKRFTYRAGQALVVNVKMPLFGTVSAASPKELYLGIVIQFDLAIMREVINGLDIHLHAPDANKGGGVFVTDLSDALIDWALRSLRLLETPKAIPLLYPGIMREICYWLLTGPNGGHVMRIAMANGHEQRVINAIHRLRDRFADPVRIDVWQLSPK